MMLGAEEGILSGTNIHKGQERVDCCGICMLNVSIISQCYVQCKFCWKVRMGENERINNTKNIIDKKIDNFCSFILK